MSLRNALSLIAAAAAFTAAGAWAQSFQKMDAPQPTDGSGKIEVIEFFWYGCPHCYAMEPAVAAWLKTKPADVEFKRVPSYAGSWVSMAELFYTLEAMGKIETMHTKVFDAIHKDHLNLNNKKVLDKFLADNGIDPAEYDKVQKSFSVVNKLNRDKQLTMLYQVDSVPRFFIAGKYVTSGDIAHGNDKIMPAIDEAIAAVRKEKH
ncbi:MAG: thiol:disulfide interchange protein DsbA/DsbL [Usitatibacter sp.]